MKKTFYDTKGFEITDGCTIYNPADINPYQFVKEINGELWFGKIGTYENSTENDWCKLDKKYETEKFWTII